MKYCLLGEKLGHSYSKEIHAYCGLDYVLKEVTPCMVADFAFSNEFSGYNVTIPYKKTVMPYLDFISEDAKAELKKFIDCRQEMKFIMEEDAFAKGVGFAVEFFVSALG